MIVSNLHPSRRNLVTCYFGFMNDWICSHKDIKRETFLLISRENIVVKVHLLVILFQVFDVPRAEELFFA